MLANYLHKAFIFHGNMAGSPRYVNTFASKFYQSMHIDTIFTSTQKFKTTPQMFLDLKQSTSPSKEYLDALK